MNQRKTVALIFGGASVEHDISVRGADFIAGELMLAGLAVLKVLITQNGEWLISKSGEPSCAEMNINNDGLVSTFPVRLGEERGLIANGEILHIDAALPLLHGELGEDGVVQGALTCAGIPFIGCDTVCGAIGIDKAFTKLIASAAGVPVTRFIYSTGYESEGELIRKAEELIGYPMFVKPTRLGSSIGAGVARDRSELQRAVENALKEGSGRIMIEELVEPMRELECAVIRTNGKLLFTNIGEINYKNGFYDYDSKYGDSRSVRITTSAQIDEITKSIILSYAELVARAVGVTGISRIDFFMHGEELYFNEINTMPGMTEASMFPMLAEGMGIPMHKLLKILTEEITK